ncbi:16S rRNA (uracil1498-N3)-methyltransferase [Litorimonas taeanensis]|uniref:Ribosomal RNA small subunit methyltransferase E n=1 Tax=Litorimonas taeanensis TaxID=568099 RepID=A0A420WE38_9PROT|nr:16S rRNA (uracil(1498)-N(3))-methyltransferase [Litorimonas taeanensis]RKQ69281.1 16S rRNA (uracil1498-N3)-methyltransferase [Litorimonas taeanensis]
MRENYTLKRLYCDQAFSEGAIAVLPKAQAHYLGTVLRMGVGDSLRLFNGREGEWRGEIISHSRKHTDVKLVEPLRAMSEVPDIALAFAPIRRHRTSFIFEKGTELGVSRFEPVITARTQFPKLSLEKAQAQIIEAAEQTERLDVPNVCKPVRLLDWIGMQAGRQIIFADEAGDALPAREALKSGQPRATLLIGPEGGFTEDERQALRQQESVLSVSLGPRILRADTAALSLLTLWQSLHGDWNNSLK